MKKTVFAAILVIVMLTGCISLPNSGKTINTMGQSTIDVQPDEAVVYFAVETLEPTAEASKNANSEITDKVYAALYKINIPRESIETSYFNIYEEFDWTQNGQKSKGFKTVNNLKITTENFGEVGEIIDAAINSGATRIDSIQFELSDAKQNEYKKQAIAAASKDAKEKAQALADGVDAELGDLVSISNSDYNYRPYPLYAASSMDSAELTKVATTEISPQTLQVSASVSVVYEID